jgi:hypothetical protein
VKPVGEDDSDSSSLLVFDHIPKTAGTTFRRSYLTAALPRGQRWILTGGDRNAEDLRSFLNLSSERRRRIRIVAGHHAEALRTHVPAARFLTIVRDPVDRAISSYLHARFHPGGEALWPDVLEKQMGLREFVQKYERPNAQTLQLLGAGRVDEQKIKQGLKARYALVGYTEALDQFIFLLHVLEGFPLCLYNNRLVRKERSAYVPPPEDLEFVRELNAQDLLLHRVVRAEFQNKLDELPDDARVKMARYLEALERFRGATEGDPRQSVRLEPSALGEGVARTLEFVSDLPGLSVAPPDVTAGRG